MNKVCVVAGVGPGNGASISNRFAAEGYMTVMLARNEDYLAALSTTIDNSIGIACDLSSAESIEKAFARINREFGSIDTLVYNAGSGLWRSALETTLDDLYDSWAVNVRGLLACTHQVLPGMLEKNAGNVMIIGATASLRGGPQSAAFASAKAGQRSLAQSLARKLGSEGIHVGYLIIDGIIDLERSRARLPDKPDDFFMKADEIAKNVYALTQQDRSAWTFELDLRPFGENW
ncbi:MAG: SDR family NAD(P)-dependent oxidoreductase [Candidatus Thioglobus sp.]|nr:MAG: SDR family NAD(P)-dependent oxidoreductase [Candidatus Thioglobus sp.]